MARYRSKYGELKIPIKRAYTKEVDGQVVVVGGEKVEFHDYIFQTEDPKIIKFLDEDTVCSEMQKNGVFLKVDQEALDTAVGKQETLEEKEARLAKELAEIKKKKKAPTAREKGKKKTTKAKSRSKKEKPAF